MLKPTNDTFILNGCVYWRYIQSELTVRPNVLKETFSDKFYKINYKEDTKVEIIFDDFHRAYRTFKEEKDDPESVDRLWGDVLESIWLAKIMYTSQLMTFDQ